MTAFPHVLITGATGQLGSALTDRLAERCHRLSLCALEEDKLADQAARVTRQHDIAVTATALDVRDEAALNEWIRSSDAEMPIDLAIMNAGIGGQVGPGAMIESPDRSAALVDANLNGVLHTLHAVLPQMLARGRGHLVVVSSLSAVIGYDRAPVYAATKAALRVLCLSLRPSLSARGIGLTLACPGFLDSPMQDGHHPWRPFSLSPQAAADAIVTAAGKRRAQTHFPLTMAALVRTLALMPLPLREAIYRRLSSGGANRSTPKPKGAPTGAP
ncbi:MAG: SDR family NAD(P)-dependent oxidoreductase [Hyphomicrobiales bacterium]|nr:SDR family NAD(P)-dependent oxidoreductase [Hyphomicrobiales bacterium]